MNKLQFGAAEGAESEVGLHNPVAESTAQDIGGRRQRRGRLGRRRQGVGLREHELAVITIQGRLLAGPPPNGNEEELEDLLVLNQIGGRATVYTPGHTRFQHLTHLLL